MKTTTTGTIEIHWKELYHVARTLDDAADVLYGVVEGLEQIKPPPGPGAPFAYLLRATVEERAKVIERIADRLGSAAMRDREAEEIAKADEEWDEGTHAVGALAGEAHDAKAKA